jgi:hypothetical protein
MKTVASFITKFNKNPRFQYGSKLLDLYIYPKGFQKYSTKFYAIENRVHLFTSLSMKENSIYNANHRGKKLICTHKFANLDKKVSEFNYKLLNNLLSNNLFLSKCFKGISSKCNSCLNDTENSGHLINIRLFRWLIDWLIDYGFTSRSRIFTNMETSPLPVKGCKI